MKKVILLTLILISNFIFAQQSSLNIFSEDGKSFYLILNGIRQNQNPETNVRVDQLTNNYYHAKIIFADRITPTIEKRMLMVVDVDTRKGNMTYRIKKNRKGKSVLRFYSFALPSAQYAVNDNVAVVHYNTIPMPSINFNIINTQTTIINHESNVNVGVNIGVNVDIHEVHHTTTPNLDGNVGQEVEVYDCYRIGRNDFRDAVTSIEGKSFSDSKLTLAKQIAKNYCLTTQQIKKVVGLFDFESTKLEFAKYAYLFCFDPENYWRISDAFEFESTIEELNRFIENQN